MGITAALSIQSQRSEVERGFKRMKKKLKNFIIMNKRELRFLDNQIRIKVALLRVVVQLLFHLTQFLDVLIVKNFIMENVNVDLEDVLSGNKKVI